MLTQFWNWMQPQPLAKGSMQFQHYHEKQSVCVTTVPWNLNQDTSPWICDDEIERTHFSPRVLLWRPLCAVRVCESVNVLVLSTRKSKNAPESTRMARSVWPPCLGGGWKQREDEERIEELLCRSGVLSLTPWEHSDLNGHSSRLRCGARTLLWWLIWGCLANEWFMTWFTTLTTACDPGRKRRGKMEGSKLRPLMTCSPRTPSLLTSGRIRRSLSVWKFDF